MFVRLAVLIVHWMAVGSSRSSASRAKSWAGRADSHAEHARIEMRAAASQNTAGGVGMDSAWRSVALSGLLLSTQPPITRCWSCCRRECRVVIRTYAPRCSDRLGSARRGSFPLTSAGDVGFRLFCPAVVQENLEKRLHLAPLRKR